MVIIKLYVHQHRGEELSLKIELVSGRSYGEFQWLSGNEIFGEKIHKTENQDNKDQEEEEEENGEKKREATLKSVA